MSDAPAHRGALGLWLRWLLFVALAAGLAWWTFGRSETAADPDAGGDRGERRAAAVRTTPVGRATVSERATHAGELRADAVDIAPRVAGRVLEVTVRVGDSVAAGALLARIDDAELVHQLEEVRAQRRAAMAAGTRARSDLDAARREVARVKGLADDQLVSRLQLETLQARVTGLAADGDAADAQRDEAAARVGVLEQRIADCRLVAPFAGTVSKRLVDPGSFVQPGASVVRLVAKGPLRVQFEVPEHETPYVAAGVTVAVRTPATGADEVPAHVTGVAGEVHPVRRSVLLEAQLDAPPAGWLPGMSAEVTLATRTVPDALVVPGPALADRLDAAGVLAKGVFVVEGEAARWVPVRVLARERERVAVEGALTVGALVVVRGQAELGDGAPVRVLAPEDTR